MPGRSEILDAIKDYDSKKYSEEFYNFYLGKISRSVDPGEQLVTDVRHLFHWFLGKVHTSETEAAEVVEVNGIKYYLSGTAPSNTACIEEAVKKENLWAGLAFKNGNLPIENFLNYAKSITRNSIVMPAFFIHIFKPGEYPILNSKVWAAYREELGKNVFINTKPKNIDNYLEYVSYCSYLKRRLGLSLREIDKGLWVMGERLKEMARQQEKVDGRELEGQIELFTK